MKQYTVEKARLANGEEIAYRKAGSGENAVLLIHGNMSSSVHWQTTMEALEGDYTVIAPDLRGFGDSSYNNRFDSLKELAEDVQELLEIIGMRKFAAVGWSAGGGVAMELAVLMPEAVSRLILINPVPVTGYPMYKKDSAGHPVLTQPLTNKFEIAMDPVQVAPVLKAFEDGNREFMRMVWNGTIYNKKQPPSENYEHYLDAVMQQRCLVDLDYALVKFNMTGGRLSLLKCPITVIQSELDMVVPMSWSRQSFELIKQGAAEAKLITLAESGHSPITDDPEAFFEMLKAEL